MCLCVRMLVCLYRAMLLFKNIMPKIFQKFARQGLWGLFSMVLTGLIVVGVLYVYLEIHLPNINKLKDVHLQVPLKIYTSDHKLMAQFGTKRRIPVKIGQIPKPLIDALLATEDARYYEHSGVDFIGLVRAAVAVIRTGQKVQGASTITMQVARNFFLTRKKTYTRKINEILLALKIDRNFSKNDILQLYLNKVFLGQRAYGVAAAAQVYYGKKLNQLTLAQMAMIAGLPQAPSRDNPISNPKAAKERRNHVLERMLELGFVDHKSYETAIHAPITAKWHGESIEVDAPYVAEMVRQEMDQKYGKAVEDQGFTVTTTVNSKDQINAIKSLKAGLWAYNKRHGYHPTGINLGAPSPSVKAAWLKNLKTYPVIKQRQIAVVWSEQGQSLQALLANGQQISINWAGMSWAHSQNKQGRWNPSPQQASDIVRPGDLIWVQQQNQQWQLSQVPQVQGALISLNPNNGAILALRGGFDFRMSHFNRAVQAMRQPGSNFKPFVYSAALNKGNTLASIFNDAPIVLKDTGENALWRPHNDNYHFNGPTRLIVGLEQSINLVSVRILKAIGIPYTIDYATRFGFTKQQLPDSLSLALGSVSVTPMQIVRGYGVFANGGYLVKPYVIQSIKNNAGKVIYTAQPKVACAGNCLNQQTTTAKDLAPQAITPQNAFLMTQALRAVVRKGTGQAARVLHRHDLGGKTGTTNKKADAWFTGFNSNIVTTVWVGNDDNTKPIHEWGAQAALPIWIAYMRTAMQGMPEATMAEPSGIVTVRIDPKTGLLAYPGQKNAMFEYFRKQYVPTQYASAAQDDKSPVQNDEPQDSEAEIF